MQPEQSIDQIKSKLEDSLKHFQDELSKLRTGRAHAGVLDKVMVEAYGVNMPLKQLANISAPEAQLLQITPFDTNNLQAIASAIREDKGLGLNPVDDGMVIRIQVPALTTERRAEIVKQLGDRTEECMIAMRNARHEVIKELEQAKKDRKISEDDYKRNEKQIEDLMNQYKIKADSLSKVKEQEIMTV